MLFWLAMELLHRMFQQAQHMGFIHQVHRCCDNFRMSLYADDAAVFIQPTAQGWEATKLILSIFDKATELTTSMEKTELYPIRCDGINLQQVI